MTELTTPTGPGNSPMSPRSIVAVALYLIFTSVLVLYGLIKIWPHPTPSGQAKAEDQVASTAAPSQSPIPQALAQTSSTAASSQSPISQTSPQTSPEGSPVPPTQTPTSGSAPTPQAVGVTSPSPSPTNGRAQPEPEVISFFGGLLRANIYAERRLLLIVILAGALGSLMHALRSLYWYTGNRLMVWSWVGFYLILPFTGAILSVIFYFVVRGGFFSPQASFGDTSPFGFAALSALVGLFSSPATLKLKEVAETIFTKPQPGADTKPQDSLPPSGQGGAATPQPSISLVTPSSGAAAGATKVIIAGTGFTEGVVVKFGDVPAVVTSSSSVTIEVVTAASVSGPGIVDVEVTNPDGQQAKLAQGYTYQ